METKTGANPFEPLVKRAKKELEELLLDEKELIAALHAATDEKERSRLHARLHALHLQMNDKRDYIRRFGQ